MNDKIIKAAVEQEELIATLNALADLHGDYPLEVREIGREYVS